MGEARKDALRFTFYRRLKLEFHGTKITSDAGLLAYRELDEALGLTSAIDSELRDIRTGKNTQHGLIALLRQSIYSVANLRWKSSSVVRFYNKRGTAEQWIKEDKYALKWTRLSCHYFVDNQVRLQLFALAYNLGNLLRRLALPKSVKKWSLRTLREKLIKIGAKMVRHSRYITFQMAKVAVPRMFFCEILNRIRQLRSLPIPERPG
jgi:hypothetical protein